MMKHFHFLDEVPTRELNVNVWPASPALPEGQVEIRLTGDVRLGILTIVHGSR